MSEKNLKSRKKSQTRKISVERVLKIMLLLDSGKAPKKVLKEFRDDLEKTNPKIKKMPIFELFQRQLGILERKTTDKALHVQATAQPEEEVTPQELKEIHEAVKQLEPPPIPVSSNPSETIDKLKLELDEAYRSISEVSNIALQFKAEMLVERKENDLIVKTFNELIPAKIAEAMNITVERVSKGRELRRQQVLHALNKNDKNDASLNN